MAQYKRGLLEENQWQGWGWGMGEGRRGGVKEGVDEFEVHLMCLPPTPQPAPLAVELSVASTFL
jgi:hypothetical protein